MTFSLVGRCARTGMLGAIVTTSSIAVGSRCPYARAGVGAVLTQNRTDPRLGPLALDLLARGFRAEEAMRAIVAATPHRHWRQLAIIDAVGHTATYSGESVRGEKGEAQARDCASIANIVRSAEIPRVMVARFETSPDQPLARRLIDALAAGEAAGGEIESRYIRGSLDRTQGGLCVRRSAGRRSPPTHYRARPSVVVVRIGGRSIRRACHRP